MKPNVSGLHFHVEYPQQKSVSNFMHYVIYFEKKRLIGEKKMTLHFILHYL